MSSTDSAGAIIKEIVIEAAAERVFDALTDPQQRVAWWGAAGRFQATHMDSDLRPGGAWEMTGTGIGGKPFRMHGQYRSVERPRVLEMTWMADWDEGGETIVRFDLVDQDGRTTVRLTHSGFTTPAGRERYQGWPWLLTLLQAYVQKAATA